MIRLSCVWVGIHCLFLRTWISSISRLSKKMPQQFSICSIMRKLLNEFHLTFKLWGHWSLVQEPGNEEIPIPSCIVFQVANTSIKTEMTTVRTTLMLNSPPLFCMGVVLFFVFFIVSICGHLPCASPMCTFTIAAGIESPSPKPNSVVVPRLAYVRQHGDTWRALKSRRNSACRAVENYSWHFYFGK